MADIIMEKVLKFSEETGEDPNEVVWKVIKRLNDIFPLKSR